MKMAFHNNIGGGSGVSAGSNGFSGRRSPGHHPAARNSPTNSKKSKFAGASNTTVTTTNNNNNNLTTNCCTGHYDTQQSVAKRHSETSQSQTSSLSSSKSTFIDRRSTLVRSGLFLLCIVVYWNALPCDFVFDDVTAIRDNKDLRPHVPLKNLFRNDFWGTPMNREQSHKSYRPLTVLTFRWNFAVGGLDPLGYHLVNVVLHGVVTGVYFDVCRMVASALVSLVASVLFALHPVRLH